MNNIALKEKFYQKKLLVLIGHMGSGKSSIGKILARNLNWNFYDSDKIIENKLKTTINNIFKIKGEIFFRRIEKKTIAKLLKKNNAVVAVGGGSILEKETRDLISKKTISIFLNVDIEVLVKRLKRSNKRPLLNNVDIKKKILTLNDKRARFYEKADIEIRNINNIDQSIKKILKEIIS